MQWWLILLVGLVFGLVVLGVAALGTRGRLERLRLAMLALDERRKAAERLKGRAEKLQADIEALQAQLPQRR
ncbi:MAG TPA: hypothetical protein VE172_05600 [Stackebrandtia sp.]|jgi:hypothetical protein|uniref:hypothetical protein n=1 Tax=Stackebrandtia sp. TaxID=2023065 RepID=UPI002D619798|nr:hypothetical protein [Stackebrandtia sp.]HZE38269.1 hypothetical protein [Stackebrandtia sp.]